MQNFENSVRSAEDKEAFNNIKIDLLKFISKVKSEYDILNIIFDWSKMMEQEINHMTSIIFASRPISTSNNALFASKRETQTLSTETFECPQCAGIFYSKGFLQSDINLKHNETCQ
nr:hypothetical transcript [Hymenolepis microstoma]